MKAVQLGGVLTRRDDRVIPSDDPDREFLVPTLTQEGALTPREPGIGKNPPDWRGQYFSSGSRWFRMRADDLVFSQIDLWKGCVTIVPTAFDGAIATQEFPIYEIDGEQLDPYYLKLVLRSRYFQRAIRAITTGHSNRRRTQAYDFENLTIFVPEDIEVQRRIAAYVRGQSDSVEREDQTYRSLLNRFDGLVTGDLRPNEFLPD